jgi:hypothetical protein
VCRRIPARISRQGIVATMSGMHHSGKSLKDATLDANAGRSISFITPEEMKISESRSFAKVGHVSGLFWRFGGGCYEN